MATACAEAPTGLTAVVGGEKDQVLDRLAELGLSAATFNGPGQIVAGGRWPVAGGRWLVARWPVAGGRWPGGPESVPDAATRLDLLQRIGGALAVAVVTVVLSSAAHEAHGR